VLVVVLVGDSEGSELVRAIADGLAHAGHRPGVAVLLDTRSSLRYPNVEGLRVQAAQVAALRSGGLASHAAIVTAPTPHRRLLAQRFGEAMADHGMDLRPRRRSPG
jgi:hypothetical protein